MEFLQTGWLWIIDYWQILKNWIADPVSQPTIIIIGLIAAFIAILGIFKPILNVIAKPFMKKKSPPEDPPSTSSTEDIAKAAIDSYEKGKQSAATELQQDLAQRDQQIAALIKAVEALQTERKEAETEAEQTTIDTALAHLKDGNTNEAEAVFVSILEDEAKRGQAANKLAAAAACHIGALAFLHDTDKALKAYKRATELDPYNADGWNMLGHLQYRLGQLVNATKSFEKVLALGKQYADKSLIAIALGNLGIIYKTLGDLNKAEDVQLKSLKIDEQLGNKKGIASSLTSLGIIYKRQGDLQKAEHTELKALKIKKQLNDEQGIANSLGNLGNIYLLQDNLEKAENVQLEALKIDKQRNYKQGIAQCYTNLSVIYQAQGYLDKAKVTELKALQIEKYLGNKHGVATSSVNLGNIYLYIGNIPEAFENWQKALALFTEVGAKPEIEMVSGWLKDANCPEPKKPTSD